MGYKMTTSNRWAKTRAVTLQAVVTQAAVATVNSAGVELGDQHQVRLDLVVTAASGTAPTLNVKVQTSKDNATWVDVLNGAFPQATAASSAHLIVSPLDRFVRLVEVMAGTTPSFTYSVTGESA